MSAFGNEENGSFWRFAALRPVASNIRLLTKAELASRYRASVYLFTA
jgi:hypothetical protein